MFKRIIDKLRAGTAAATAAGPSDAQLIHAYVKAAIAKKCIYDRELTALPEAKPILEADIHRRVALLLAALDELRDHRSRPYDAASWHARSLECVIALLLRPQLPFDEKSLDRLMRIGFTKKLSLPLGGIMRAVERYVEQQPLTDTHRELLKQLRERLDRDGKGDARKIVDRIDAIIAPPAKGVSRAVNFEPGEPWADAAIDALQRMEQQNTSATPRDDWQRLLNHAITAAASKPSGTWLKTASQFIDAIRRDAFCEKMTAWLPLVGTPGPGKPMRGWAGDAPLDPTVLAEHNADILKGLVWAIATIDSPQMAHLLGDLAEVCFKKIPVHGARCPKVANACLIALSMMKNPDAVAQISRIQTKAKKPSARKMVEKALSASAAQQGVSPEELEEMSVPDFGFDASGIRRTTIGEWTAEIAIAGTRDVELRWRKVDGDKAQSSIPADVKRDHADALKRVKRSLKEIETILPAQAARIERLLLDDRARPVDLWRQRYLDHPLLRHIARRLIWQFDDVTFIAQDEAFVDASGAKVKLPADKPVRLWHPIESAASEVLAWRRWLESNRITQPFKQAHREIYVLTDAERQTRNYSNRFAAHILRQHQFQALCHERDWTYSLMGNFDSHNTPTRTLPRQQMKVEFWVDAAATAETSDAGIFLHIATDQVRFYPWQEEHLTPRQRHERFMQELEQIRAGRQQPQAESTPLDQIPPRVFSELMRDVDLFVGVCSVGNDPNWQDHGGGRFTDYWQAYSFGELTESAQSRRDVLSRLLPKLSIADRASLSDKFLTIRGDLRTYHIHLGSGNIQMDPNSQYLCIVQDRRARSQGSEQIFLPFEGDAMLSIILSKAFLLAADKSITDESILRQIRRA